MLEKINKELKHSSFRLHFSYDYLYVFDGIDVIAALTGVLPEVVSSTGPDIYLNFLSDDSEARPGFKIRFDAGMIRLIFMI